MLRFEFDAIDNEFPTNKVLEDKKRRCDRKKLYGLAFNLLKQTLKKKSIEKGKGRESNRNKSISAIDTPTFI